MSPLQKPQITQLKVFEFQVSQCVTETPVKLDRCNLQVYVPGYNPDTVDDVKVKIKKIHEGWLYLLKDKEDTAFNVKMDVEKFHLHHRSM